MTSSSSAIYCSSLARFSFALYLNSQTWLSAFASFSNFLLSSSSRTCSLRNSPAWSSALAMSSSSFYLLRAASNISDSHCSLSCLWCLRRTPRSSLYCCSSYNFDSKCFIIWFYCSSRTLSEANSLSAPANSFSSPSCMRFLYTIDCSWSYLLNIDSKVLILGLKSF
jgi:hypothetical protein